MLIFVASALLFAQAATPLAPNPDAAERAADPQDRMICKRFAVTGSLVDSTRTCKTKRDWERDRDNIRANGPGVDSCRDRANGGSC